MFVTTTQKVQFGLKGLLFDGKWGVSKKGWLEVSKCPKMGGFWQKMANYINKVIFAPENNVLINFRSDFWFYCRNGFYRYGFVPFPKVLTSYFQNSNFYGVCKKVIFAHFSSISIEAPTQLVENFPKWQQSYYILFCFFVFFQLERQSILKITSSNFFKQGTPNFLSPSKSVSFSCYDNLVLKLCSRNWRRMSRSSNFLLIRMKSWARPTPLFSRVEI